MTVTIATAEPLAPVIEPFAQVDPAIVGALQMPNVRPLDSLGGRVMPVGAWLPVTGNTMFRLPTPTPTATFTPSATPLPTLTLTLTQTLTPTFTLIPSPIPQNGMVPPGGVWVNGAFIPPDCAPAGMPVGGPLTQRFHSAHIGIDIGIPIGTPVVTPHSGQVIYAGWSERGYGNLVVVKNNRFITYYGHFNSVSVVVGQWVTAGSVVGLSGSTGNSTGPHLHYEIRIDDIPVDPLTFESRGYPHC